MLRSKITRRTTIRLLARGRSCLTPRAHITQLSVLRRFEIAMEIITQPTALKPYLAIETAVTTPRWVTRRSMTTASMGWITPQLVQVLSLVTSAPASTRRSASMRSLTTPPVTIPPLEISPFSTTAVASTTLPPALRHFLRIRLGITIRRADPRRCLVTPLVPTTPLMGTWPWKTILLAMTIWLRVSKRSCAALAQTILRLGVMPGPISLPAIITSTSAPLCWATRGRRTPFASANKAPKRRALLPESSGPP